jgi:integrase
LLAHQTPLHGEHSRLNWCPGTLNHYTHSLRRGFASWATANGWDLKTLMEHVGWKNAQSAMRYIDREDPFNQRRIEQNLYPLYSK